MKFADGFDFLIGKVQFGVKRKRKDGQKLGFLFYELRQLIWQMKFGFNFK